MSNEFSDRISAQRAILAVINEKSWPAEALFGLSNKAIERWVNTNRLGDNLKLVNQIRKVSEKLFFLANKSQEVSDEYQLVRAEIMTACHEIHDELKLIADA